MSGVYLPAANGPASHDRRRYQGSPLAQHTLGLYHWDFNVAGVVYERATSEDLHESFERRLAKPLSIENCDWQRRRARHVAIGPVDPNCLCSTNRL